MKISKKLILTFVMIEIISSIAGVVGFIVMTHMDLNYSKALTDYGFSQGDIGLFNTEFNNNLTILRDIIITSDTQAIKAYTTQLSESDTKIDNNFVTMKKGMLSEKEISYYNNIKENLEKFSKIKKQIVTLGASNNDLVAQAILTAQGNPISENIRNDTNLLISEKTTMGKKIADSLSAEGSSVISSSERGVSFLRASNQDHYLFQAHYKTKKGNEFLKNSIYEILNNERFIGVYLFNKAKKRNFRGKRNSHFEKPLEEQIRLEGAIPQIISKELWDTVLALRSITHKRKCRAKHFYLLSSLVYCGECKGNLLEALKENGYNKSIGEERNNVDSQIDKCKSFVEESKSKQNKIYISEREVRDIVEKIKDFLKRTALMKSKP